MHLKGLIDMTDRDLRKLSRLDLLELLIEQRMELIDVKERLQAAEEKLQSREIIINEAGSIAEAALQLNDVFTSTELACKQYLDNVQIICERQKRTSNYRLQKAREQAEQILQDARRSCNEMEEAARLRCDEMLLKAETEAQQYWNEVSEKLEAFYDQHIGLRQLMTIKLPTAGNEAEPSKTTPATQNNGDEQ